MKTRAKCFRILLTATILFSFSQHLAAQTATLIASPSTSISASRYRPAGHEQGALPAPTLPGKPATQLAQQPAATGVAPHNRTATRGMITTKPVPAKKKETQTAAASARAPRQGGGSGQ